MTAEIITIERHILEQERFFPEATGERGLGDGVGRADGEHGP